MVLGYFPLNTEFLDARGAYASNNIVQNIFVTKELKVDKLLKFPTMAKN